MKIKVSEPHESFGDDIPSTREIEMWLDPMRRVARVGGDGSGGAVEA